MNRAAIQNQILAAQNRTSEYSVPFSFSLGDDARTLNLSVTSALMNLTTTPSASASQDNPVAPAASTQDVAVTPAVPTQDDTVIPAVPTQDNTVIPAVPSQDNTVIPAPSGVSKLSLLFLTEVDECYECREPPVTYLAKPGGPRRFVCLTHHPEFLNAGFTYDEDRCCVLCNSMGIYSAGKSTSKHGWICSYHSIATNTILLRDKSFEELVAIENPDVVINHYRKYMVPSAACLSARKEKEMLDAAVEAVMRKIVDDLITHAMDKSERLNGASKRPRRSSEDTFPGLHTLCYCYRFYLSSANILH